MPSRIHIEIPAAPAASYDVIIGSSLKSIARSIRKKFTDRSLFVISDSNVARLYGTGFMEPLFRGGSSAHLITIPAGEKSKTVASATRLQSVLIRLGADRRSVIIALGGGMTGDLAGFVAATLLRSVTFVQVPTTLLAQVDSSIGGKVGVNHPVGKNLIGAFLQPAAVYADTATLATLPAREFVSGLAEVIKYGIILDRKLFEYLEANAGGIRERHTSHLTHLISRCCELKGTVVGRDPLEAGYRRILNFGHTIGHAVESGTRYRLRHGEAIAIGMAAEARLSAAMGLLPDRVVSRIVSLLTTYGLPVDLPRSLPASAVISATASDKKRHGTAVYYTLLKRLGKAVPGIPAPAGLLHKILPS